MTRILLDTDVLIDHLRGYRQLSLSDPSLGISVVTRCELFAGRNTDEAVLRQTLNLIEEITVDRAIAEAAGRIRRTTGIPIPDALIAATAVEYDVPLMTRNERHFGRVSGLTLQRPPESAESPASEQAAT